MNARWVILGLLVAGCAEEVGEEREIALHQCPEGAERVLADGGHLAWCATTDASGGRVATGPWMSYHEPPAGEDRGAPASEGELRDGVMRGPWRSWWPDGTPAAALDATSGAGTMVLFDERGKEIGRIPYQDGLPVLCGEPTTHEDVARAFEARCGEDATKAGFVRTTHPDGTTESLTYTWKGQPHGRFVAFHPNGKPWLAGEHLGGKRHGPWLYFDAEGALQADGEAPPLDGASLGVTF